jgi:hypothetical protein
LAAALRKAARQAWWPYRAVVEWDDASQEMWAWVYDGRLEVPADQLVPAAAAAVRAYCRAELEARNIGGPDPGAPGRPLERP